MPQRLARTRTAAQRLSLSGRRVEPLFVQTLLEALRPAGVEASRCAAELGAGQRRQEQQRLSDEFKQCEYEAEARGGNMIASSRRTA